MSVNNRVQKSNIEIEDLKMLRALRLCQTKAFFLEPYVSSIQLKNNYASAQPLGKVQNLPKLPVPKLHDTLSKYLKTVKPFLNDEEFAATTSIVKEFEGGIGQKLQSLLEKRAENHQNWLEEWWLNTAYLEYRDPVVIFSSPGLVLPFRKFNNQQEQLKYAAKTILAALDYKSLIDNDKIPVEMMGKNPLDMSQYKKVFGTCRIPMEKRDKLSFNDSKHMTVMHNNHIFHLDLWGDDGKRLNVDQIAQALKKIVDMSSSPTEEAIGVLTSEHRDNWAKAYQLLIKDSVNKASLSDVERSVGVLCLDGAAGLRGDDAARRTLAAAQTIHGGGSASNGANRWFDKTIQFIVGADGITGLTYEHSPAEGQPIAVLTDFIIKYVDKELIELLNTQPKREIYDLSDVVQVALGHSKPLKNVKIDPEENDATFQISLENTNDTPAMFKLEHKEIIPQKQKSSANFVALKKLHNLLYNRPRYVSNGENLNDQKKEILFDILVAQLKMLCCKTSSKNLHTTMKGPQFKFLNNFLPKKTQDKLQPTDKSQNNNEFMFLIMNEEIKSKDNDDLILVDPETLGINSSVLLLGPLTTPLTDAQIKIVMNRISGELMKPEYISFLQKLSNGTLNENNTSVLKNFITGPNTRRYIKAHRCNHQSKLSKIYGGPKWLICTGYLNINTPSLYD
ncbi:unnamed protein product, partial [Brenthis ino]